MATAFAKPNRFDTKFDLWHEKLRIDIINRKMKGLYEALLKETFNIYLFPDKICIENISIHNGNRPLYLSTSEKYFNIHIYDDDTIYINNSAVDITQELLYENHTKNENKGNYFKLPKEYAIDFVKFYRNTIEPNLFVSAYDERHPMDTYRYIKLCFDSKRLVANDANNKNSTKSVSQEFIEFKNEKTVREQNPEIQDAYINYKTLVTLAGK